MLGIALPGGNPGRLLRAVVEQPAHLPARQTSGTPGGRRGAEIVGEVVRAPVSLHLKRKSAQRHRHSRSDVVAEGDGAKEARPADAELFAGGERGGYDRAPRM